MKKFFFSVTLLFLFFLLSTSIYPQNNALELFQSGIKQEQQGDLYSALFTYQKVIKLNPYFVDAKIALSRIYYKLKDYKKSEKILKEALTQEPKNIDALNMLGNVEIALNNFKEAEEIFTRAVSIDPTNIESQYGFANLYRLEGRYKEAIEKYQYILKIYPNDARSYIYIGDIYMELGKFTKAGGFYRNAVSLDSHSSFTHLKLAKYYYKMGRLNSTTNKKIADSYLNAGIDEANTTLEIDPENRDALETLGDIYLFKKGFTEALNYYQKLLKLKPDDNLLLYTIGYCYESLGMLDKSAINYYKALTIRRDDEVNRFRLEEIIRKLYKTDLKNKLRKELSDYHYDKGKYFFNKNYLEKAFFQFKRAVQLEPLNPTKRLSFAEVFKIEKYYERYLYELKNIIRDTLDVNTQDLNDRIEILENIISKGFPARWGVSQYLEDSSSPYYVPKSHTKIAILNYFSIKNDKTIHKYLSKTLKEYIEYFLYSYPKIELVQTSDISQTEITSQDKALKLAQSIKSDFYTTFVVNEDEESIKIEVELRSSINGELIKRFSAYSTGNDRLFNSLFSLSVDINNSIPLQGIIVKIEGDRVLINLGRRHGVKEKMSFLIVRKGDYSPNRNYDVSTISDKSILGSITITKVGELVSEGVYKYKGIFNRVNEYDSVLLNPGKNAKNNKNKNEKKQP